MKMLWRVFLIAGFCLSATAHAGGSHLGVWSGTLTEMIVAGKRYEQYEVTLTVTPRKYRIDYDTLECGGVLRLLIHQGRFYRFQDELNYGLKNCQNGGRTEIHFIDAEQATFQWFDKQGVLKVEGRLKRQPQLMI
jgi:hypothetical protein